MAMTSRWEDPFAVRVLWVAAAICIQGRLIANLLDGMVAIEGKKASPVGELYNEVPDRISDSAIFIGAGLSAGGMPSLGLSASLVAVFVAYIRAIGASAGVGQVFLGPMAKQQRMALFTFVCVLCAVLPSAWQLEEPRFGIGMSGCALILVIVGGVLTAIRRLSKIGDLMRLRAEDREASNV